MFHTPIHKKTIPKTLGEAIKAETTVDPRDVKIKRLHVLIKHLWNEDCSKDMINEIKKIAGES